MSIAHRVVYSTVPEVATPAMTSLPMSACRNISSRLVVAKAHRDFLPGTGPPAAGAPLGVRALSS